MPYNCNRKAHEKDDDYQYADAVKVMDEVRELAEKEEAEMRHYWKQTVKNDNLEVRLTKPHVLRMFLLTL